MYCKKGDLAYFDCVRTSSKRDEISKKSIKEKVLTFYVNSKNTIIDSYGNIDRLSVAAYSLTQLPVSRMTCIKDE